jgi:hypothetical protein
VVVVKVRFFCAGEVLVTRVPVREAVGVLRDERSLREVIEELVDVGFDRSDFSVVARCGVVEHELGAMPDDITHLVGEPDAPRAIYVEHTALVQAKAAIIGAFVYAATMAAIIPAVSFDASLMTTIAAAVGAACLGGFIGAMSTRLIDRHHNNYVNQQLVRGGLLLWVSTATRTLEARAYRILQRHAARHVQVRDAAYAAPNFANAINLG